jgi:ribosomal protein S27AE
MRIARSKTLHLLKDDYIVMPVLALPVRSLRGKVLEIGDDLFFLNLSPIVILATINPLSSSASTIPIRLFPNPLDYAKSRIHRKTLRAREEQILLRRMWRERVSYYIYPDFISSICKHGRRENRCKECGGSSICDHGKDRYYCVECGGKGYRTS